MKSPTNRDSQATSRSLLMRAKSNDAEAWDRLFALYAPLVLHWCKRWNVCDEDIHDLVQEVFRSVVANIGSFKKQKASDTFKGWLRVITRNKIHDHYHKLQREPRGSGGTDVQIRFAQIPFATKYPDDDASEETAYAKLVRRALEQVRVHFTAPTWQAFWRIAIDGQAANDVAVELSMSPGAVRVAKSRVLQRLRAELGDLIE